MNINEARIMAANFFYRAIKRKRHINLSNISFEITKNYLVIADHEAINDRSDEYEVPSEYYALPFSEPYNYLHIIYYDANGDGPVFYRDDNQTVIKAEDRDGNIILNIPDEIYKAIDILADDFSINGCMDAKMVMVSPGCKAVLWLANGDPGYPPEPPEYEGVCPHCGSPITELEGCCRCISCNKFYKIIYDEC